MGEAKRKSRSRAKILAEEKRCIYCSAPNDGSTQFTLEHMPPIGVFVQRSRPSGMEFATCEACNGGTKSADTAATLFALIPPRDRPDDPLFPELIRMKSAVDQQIPHLRDELFAGETKERWFPSPGGILERRVVINANGPILHAHLTTFCAKLGMALYREHVGEPLPLTGAVYSLYFLNAGLSQKTADAILSILPTPERLSQGVKTSSGQFEYRYNSDDRTIVAALASFHDNLFIHVFATSDPTTYGPVLQRFPKMEESRPERYLDRLKTVAPKSESLIVL